MKLRDRIGQIFSFPMLKSGYGLYLGQMNTLGKMTQRTHYELLAEAFEIIEQLEAKVEALEAKQPPVEDAK